MLITNGFKIKRNLFLYTVSKMEVPEVFNEWRPVEGEEANRIYKKAFTEYYILIALDAFLMLGMIVCTVSLIILGLSMEAAIYLLLMLIVIFISQYILWKFIKKNYDAISKGKVSQRDATFLYNYTHKAGIYVKYCYCQSDGMIETGYIVKENNYAILSLKPGTRVKVYAIDDKPVCILWDKKENKQNKRKYRIKLDLIKTIKMVMDGNYVLLEMFSFDHGDRKSIIADLQPSSNFTRRKTFLTRFNNFDNLDDELYNEFEERIKEIVRNDLRENL